MFVLWFSGRFVNLKCVALTLTSWFVWWPLMVEPVQRPDLSGCLKQCLYNSWLHLDRQLWSASQGSEAFLLDSRYSCHAVNRIFVWPKRAQLIKVFLAWVCAPFASQAALSVSECVKVSKQKWLVWDLANLRLEQSRLVFSRTGVHGKFGVRIYVFGMSWRDCICLRQCVDKPWARGAVGRLFVGSSLGLPTDLTAVHTSVFESTGKVRLKSIWMKSATNKSHLAACCYHLKAPQTLFI